MKPPLEVRDHLLGDLHDVQPLVEDGLAVQLHTEQPRPCSDGATDRNFEAQKGKYREERSRKGVMGEIIGGDGCVMRTDRVMDRGVSGSRGKGDGSGGQHVLGEGRGGDGVHCDKCLFAVLGGNKVFGMQCEPPR